MARSRGIRSKKVSESDRLRIGRRRQRFIFVLLLVFSARLGVAFFEIQVRGHDEYRTTAQKQQKKRIVIPPERGTIYDRNGVPLTVNEEEYGVYLVPRHVDPDEAEQFVETLTSILGVGAREVNRRLEEGGWYVRLTRGMSPEIVHQLEAANLDGVGVESYRVRRYPYDRLAGDLLGKVNTENKGLDGIELYYDEVLRGTPGYAIHQRDALGHEYPNFTFPVQAPVHGRDLHLTIDLGVQEIVEAALETAMNKTRAKAGSVVVVDPRTGEVLAMATRGGPRKSDQRGRNVAVVDQFEPGSTFKIVPLTGLYEESLAAPSDSLFCEHGTWRHRGRTIHDVHPYDYLTVEQVIEASSNICSIKLADRLGDNRLYEYARKFGFGLPAGLDFPGEPRGLLKRPDEWSALTAGSVTMGYEVMVTSVQMAMAYSAVANGGELLRPYLVRRIVDTEGGVEFEGRPQPVRRVMRPETARLVTQALVRVVESGTARSAQIDMLPVAGKTGTARKVGKGGYDHKRHTSSFAGFFPADDARYAVFVRIDEPVGKFYGGLVAAPVFHEIVENTLLTRAVDRSPALVERFRSPQQVVQRVSDGFGELPAAEPDTPALSEPMELPDGVDPRTYVKVPDFTGLGLREAIRRASRLGIELAFDGTGTIVGQDPEPGEVLTRGGVVLVRDR